MYLFKNWFCVNILITIIVKKMKQLKLGTKCKLNVNTHVYFKINNYCFYTNTGAFGLKYCIVFRCLPNIIMIHRTI